MDDFIYLGAEPWFGDRWGTMEQITYASMSEILEWWINNRSWTVFKRRYYIKKNPEDEWKFLVEMPAR